MGNTLSYVKKQFFTAPKKGNKRKLSSGSISYSKWFNPRKKYAEDKSNRGNNKRTSSEERRDAAEKNECFNQMSALVRRNHFYDLSDRLGKGGFGKVYLARRGISKYACKVQYLSKNKPNQHIFREMNLSSNLAHPLLVKHIESLVCLNFSLIFFELCEQSLFDYIQKNQRTIPERELKKYFRHLVFGLKYLHNNRICHLDIKAENFLLKDGVGKLCDLGLAAEYNGQLSNHFCGTPAYASPEMLTKTPYDGKKVDAWGAGTVLFHMIEGQPPYFEKGDDKKKIWDKVVKQQRRSITTYIPHNLRIIVDGLLEFDPRSRTNVDDITNLDWMLHY